MMDSDIRYFIRNDVGEDLEITQEAFDILFPPGAGTKNYVKINNHEYIVTLYETEDVVGVFKQIASQGPLCSYWSDEDAPLCGHRTCYTIAERVTS